MLSGLFSQVFKTFKDRDDSTSLGQVFQCWTVLMVKKDFLKVIKVRKETGWEWIPTRCYRQFTVNTAMLITFLTSTENISHEVFPSVLQPSRLSWPNPIWWSLPGKFRQLALFIPSLLPLLPLSLSALSWTRGDYKLVLGQVLGLSCIVALLLWKTYTTPSCTEKPISKFCFHIFALCPAPQIRATFQLGG